MKRKWIIGILSLALFCLTSVGLFAQSSTIEQKLLGTWVDGGNRTWTFNADGTGSRDTTALKYVAYSNKIIIYFGTSNTASACEYIFSSDNNTVMLYSNGESASHYLKKKTN